MSAPLATVALIGRLNVGKSTLFNQFTRSRDALVADFPGLTRDRRYGVCRRGEQPFTVIDTGGLAKVSDDMGEALVAQTYAAVDEADVLVFVTDAQSGLTPEDEDFVQLLRRQGKPVIVAVNKIDGRDADVITAEFYNLGLGQPVAVAASHGRGVQALIDAIVERCPDPSLALPEQQDETGVAPGTAMYGLRIAVVGRPNVGKSTLINRLLGEERLVAYDMPGTTRDSIAVPLDYDGEPYTLIDTAGVRRRSRVRETVEKFSIVKSLQAIEHAEVVVLVVDAREDIVDQDASLLGHILDAGRGLVIAVNKWDGLEGHHRKRIREQLRVRFNFVDFAPIHFISAKHGTGIRDVMAAARRVHASAQRKLTSAECTRILEDAVAGHQPPLVQGRSAKLRYAHIGGHRPPRIIIHGTRVTTLPDSYKRYLRNQFIKVLKLEGTPLKLEFKAGSNPYEGRKNKLSDRQLKKKRRLIKHVKGKR